MLELAAPAASPGLGPAGRHRRRAAEGRLQVCIKINK